MRGFCRNAEEALTPYPLPEGEGELVKIYYMVGR